MKLNPFRVCLAMWLGAFTVEDGWTAPNPLSRPSADMAQTPASGIGIVAVASGIISSATGTFDKVDTANPPVKASGPYNGQTGLDDAFSLQINAGGEPPAPDPSVNTVRGSIPIDPLMYQCINATCKGWQQFVYSTYQCIGGPCVLIQYWIIDYGGSGNDPCPTPTWKRSGKDCYLTIKGPPIILPNATTIPAADLTQLSLVATATSTTDTVTLLKNNIQITTVSSTNHLKLYQHWKAAEWNIVGDCCASQVALQSASGTPPPPVTIEARIALTDGTKNEPTCTIAEPSTAETNNLVFGTKPPKSGIGPAMIYRQTSGTGGTATCNASQSVGDTHLFTFGGLKYDFQATGEFILARLDNDFMVQARQSRVPQWPNASVNRALGVRVGKHRVAICLPQPLRVVVDGEAISLKDGERRVWPDHAYVQRHGNFYTVRGANGHALRAEVNANHINANVGLGHWPAKVSGLLANSMVAAGETSVVSRLVSRDGKVLPETPDFATLYGHYAQSWRVDKADEQLLADCGEPEPGLDTFSSPTMAFGPNQLEPKARDRAHAICTEAGVKHPALMTACIVDVAALEDPHAAEVFVSLVPPVASLTFDAEEVGNQKPEWMRWLAWSVLIAMYLWAVALTWPRRKR